MLKNETVRSRIEARVKDEATAVLGKYGLTISDAIRIFLIRVADDKAFPFEPFPTTGGGSTRASAAHSSDTRVSEG